MKLQYDRAIINEIEYALSCPGGPVQRIDLNDFEYELFLSEVGRLMKEGLVKVAHGDNLRRYYLYRGIEVKEVK